MNRKDQLSRERARGDSFKLLSECYYLPRRDLIETLKVLEKQMGRVCAEAAQYVQRMKQEFESKNNLEPLGVDYTKLFVGPYTLLAPPYGSVYLDGERRVMGDSVGPILFT